MQRYQRFNCSWKMCHLFSRCRQSHHRRG